MSATVFKTLNQHINEAVASFGSNNCTVGKDVDTSSSSKDSSELLVETVDELFDNVIIQKPI